MIVLDTNVLSELARTDPAPQVVGWVDKQALSTLYITAINLGEIYTGILILPDGRRKNALKTFFDNLILEKFQGKILAYDAAAAHVFSRLQAQARQKGFAAPAADTQIAAIVTVHQAQIATRDTTPFLAFGIPTINPWL